MTDPTKTLYVNEVRSYTPEKYLLLNTEDNSIYRGTQTGWVRPEDTRVFIRWSYWYPGMNPAQMARTPEPEDEPQWVGARSEQDAIDKAAQYGTKYRKSMEVQNEHVIKTPNENSRESRMK